ncbi:hypothetical protein PROFUN_05879 [Planoprotostelium fungivorum]|uniref:ARID domain-containing protein n=1 Tax=Planoprotostelium fungivorum TaxID=1890364 RepID=A0A2P6NKQ7_9EUKA|nr:hypothetical protein PROFUN_05879 [Planoprotostelium fungivorum]
MEKTIATPTSSPETPASPTRPFLPENYESAERKSFMMDVNKFMAEAGKPLFKIPIMGYKELDLFQLFKEVSAYGGFNEVVKNVGTWSKIWKRLDNFDPSITDSSFRLKKNYERYLLDYEHKCFPDNKGGNKEGVSAKELINNKSSSLLDLSTSIKAEKKLRKKSQMPTNQEVPRNADNTVRLPFSLGDFIVENPGNIIAQPPFVSEKYIWPVGYTAHRLLPKSSTSSETIKYTCTIKNNDGRIEFVISCTDGSTDITSHSLSSAWRLLHKRLPKTDRSVSIFGVDKFGLTHPAMLQLFSQMPNGEAAMQLQKQMIEGTFNKKRKYSSGSSSEGEEPKIKVIKRQEPIVKKTEAIMKTETLVKTETLPTTRFTQNEVDDLESAVMTLSSLKYCSVY